MKIKIAGLILLAFFMFTGASPWEGAAAISPEGELPANGRYVATNSYPRNTVVDIFNIETNRSTRVIVAGGLENPGLLALVSKEAAELIGMRAGSVSRIRMIQPSDPVAYLRFRDGVASGTPDYDSGKIITEEDFRETEREREEAARAAENEKTSSSRTAPVIVQGTPPYFLEPEWRRENRSTDIVDLPDPAGEEAEKELADKTDEDATDMLAKDADEDATDVLAKDADEDATDVLAKDADEDAADVLAKDTDEEAADVLAKDTDEDAADVLAKDTDEEAADVLAKDTGKETTEEIKEYYLVETEEKPPTNDIYGIDPSSIIPGVKMHEYTSATELSFETLPDPAPKSASSSAEDFSSEPDFSAQRIYNLERGRYYVQIAAHDAPELVESTIKEIGTNFEPVIYKDGDSWYRVLLGGVQGLNQGESAAVLQRFKSIGYKDAFVRLAK